MKLEHELEIAAPPKQVWARLTDLDRAAAGVPYLQAVERLDPEEPLGAGTRLRLRFRMGDRQVTVDATVVDYRELELLAARGHEDSVGVTAEVRWRLRPRGSGTHVEQAVTLGFDTMMARMAARAMQGRAEREVQAGLAAFRDAVEADGSAEPR